MKRCLVISMGKTTGKTLADQLQQVLGNTIEVAYAQVKHASHYTLEMQQRYKLILFTSDCSYTGATAQHKIEVPFIIGARVINHKNIEEIISLPSGTEVLLLNDSKDSSNEAIKQLKAIGLDHIKYHPCFPGVKEHPQLETIITPGEPQLMPLCGKTLIDIGSRILDLKTIYAVMEKLSLDFLTHDSLVNAYIKDIIIITRSIDKSRRAERESKRVLETIFDTVDSGIGFLTKEMKLVKVNSKLQHILRKNKRDLLEKPIQQILPSLAAPPVKNGRFTLDICGESYLLTFEKMSMAGEEAYLMMIYAIKTIKELDKSTYGRVLEGCLSPLKTFDDYLSVHPSVKEMLNRAACFSNTDATITIQGENGTGKEIIAQGIHRNSYRKNLPFVPVNIAAISASLLESELFGYEKGAFTGAKKEGKLGLFEVANGGTLFIDEIGDTPLSIQVKLLRVLQEKKIRRIGGVEEIPIDVRIITATNKDLLALVDEKKFREDLYFRLNILPLYTIPLRMRPQDINHLLAHYINIYFKQVPKQTIESIFKPQTLDFLNTYHWRGNVRELINLVEYLSCIYMGTPIALEDLPKYYLSQSQPKRRLSENEFWVIKHVFYTPGVGRSRLSKLAKESGYPLGEGQIRGLLETLQSEGLLESLKSKRGLFVSDWGKSVLLKHL